MDAASVTSSLPVVLSSGIDTLEVFTTAPILTPERERLAEAKWRVNEGGEPVPYDVLGHPFTMSAARSRRAPYILESPAMAVSLNPSARGHFPQVSVEIRSAYLWQHGPAQAVERVRTIIGSLVGFRLEAKVTRVDLTVDFQGWTPELADYARFTCKAKRGCIGLPVETFHFGAGGKVMARLYNKSLEIRQVSPDKRWFLDVWRRSGQYREGEDTWRLEFQCRRKGFASFKSTAGHLDTWSDCQSNARAMWQLLTSRWLRIPGKRTERSRAALDPAWEVLHRRGFEDATRWGGGSGDLTRVGRTALLDAEDKSFGGSVARAIGRAKVRKPGVTGDEAIWNAIRAAERASLDSGRGDLDERGEERAREHHAAVRAMADIQPMPLDQVPEPEPEPMNLTPRQPELALGVR